MDSAKQDADVLIVQTTIASAQSKDTILVGDDTDLLVLLLHHAAADINSNDIFLSPENTKASKASKTKRAWCIKQCKPLLGSKLCEHLLFMHASLHVYHQVMVWKDFNHDLKPEDWGWYSHDGRLMPLQTDKPAAPSEILDVICCSCTKDCSTKRCTCRKYSLHYAPVCGEFRGVSCTNSRLPDLSNDDMNDNDV